MRLLLSSFERLAASSGADVIVFGRPCRPYSKVAGGVRFVNARSVGKPKNDDWRGCCLLLSPDAAEPAQFVHVPYDLPHVARAIRDAGLLDEFAADLEHGGASPGARRGTAP